MMHEGRGVDAREYRKYEKRDVEYALEQAKAEGRTKTVGKGTTAEVYLVREKASPNTFSWVVKEGNLSQETRKIFQAEWRAHNEIFEKVQRDPQEHAVIPMPILGITGGGRECIVMEYLPGETLFTHMLKKLASTDEFGREKSVQGMEKDEIVAWITQDENKEILPREVAQHTYRLTEEYFEEVAREARRRTGPLLTRRQFQTLQRTMSLLHQSGIAHNDLHASNIILMQNGSIGLIDFGISKKISGATSKAKREDGEYLKMYKMCCI